MEYLVPAWHKQLIDWAYTSAQIEFDDAISHCRVLSKGGYHVGLVITDYLPHLYTQLNQLALAPDKIFSVFDYLQGVNLWSNKVVDYRDLKWPDEVNFDFTNFHILAILDGKLYARILFDTQDKILSVEYSQGEHQGELFLFDSRGFVSQIKKGPVETYLDLSGHWRFKHNTDTDHVVINPEVHRFCDKSEYDSLNELISEVIEKHFLNHIDKKDHLIVTGDDHSVVPQNIYNSYHPILSVSGWHPAEKAVKQIKSETVVVNNRDELEHVRPNLLQGSTSEIIPVFQSQFKLGHSQRLSQQRIGIFAEYLNGEQLDKILEIIYPRLLKDPDATAIYMFAYSQRQSDMVQQTFSKFRQHHQGEFILSRDEIDPGENQLDVDLPPLLTIKQQRLIRSMDVLTALDKIRLLICWGKADDFMSIAAVSVGIPMLQNFETAQLNDHKNGIIYHNMDELKEGISYYLDTLKHWNESLVYNVQMLNRYSEEHLVAKWDQVLKEDR